MLSEVTTDEDDERRKVEKNRLRLVPNLSHRHSIAKKKNPGGMRTGVEDLDRWVSIEV